MPPRPLLYYITDRRAFYGDELTRCRRLLEKIAEAARAGIDFIQLREKDLSTRNLESLAHDSARIILHNSSPVNQNRTALLINSRTDVALAAQADGVHLRSNDISPQEVKAIWHRADILVRQGSARDPLIAVSCHSSAEVAQAVANSTFAVFGPVFAKKDAPDGIPAGLAALGEAAKESIPVLALGGITLDNTRSCLAAGAAGIAAIRLFQENEIATVVSRLRQIA
jgi:thiamine-phosphate pyrophosphorylase